MIGRLASVVLVLAACGKPAEKPADAARDAAPVDAAPKPPVGLEIAKLAVQRDAAVGKLAELARGGDAEARVRATLALGQVGGPLAIRALQGLLVDPGDPVAVEAARALGIAGATEASADLAKLYIQVSDPAARAVIAEAIGRVGDEKAIPVLAAAVGEKDPRVRAAAAIALGRYGKRKVAIGEEARKALLAHGMDPEPEVSYGVAYALARAQPPVRDKEIEATLQGLARSGDDEVQAMAIIGLSAHGTPALDVYKAGLDDDDWRVRVEAMRALSSDKSTREDRKVLAEWLVTEWTSIADLEARLLSARVHPVLEGIERLSKWPKEPAVKKAIDALHEATDVTESSVPQKYTPEVLRAVDAVNCLSAAARVRAGKPLAEVLRCGEKSGAGWPKWKRIELAAGLVGEGFGGPPDARVGLLDDWWKQRDPRVKGAVAAAAVNLDDPRAARIVRDALGAEEAVVAGSAADALSERLAKNDPHLRTDVAALELILDRTKKGVADPELRLTFLETLKAAKLQSAVPLFQAAFSDANVTVRDKGRECLKALTGQDPGPGAADKPAAPPPVDPASVLGKKVIWTVTTTKGKFSVELDPAAAPWNVAALTALAQKGFYDGTVWHRVVPDFVAQGGDPTGSGWGGPGYVVPAEPSALHYVRGAVGIADAGRDTGGSQWFVMHAPAPHLDGRYTIVGKVVSGQEVVDALLVGDSITRVEVDLL